MNVLVTGANGLLGHHVVMELLKRQHSVRIIIRSRQKIYYDLDRVTVFDGNFTEYESLKKAAAGCDAIIHIAAVTAVNLLKYEDYRSINVEGTAQVIKLAAELKINTLVYISSANTIGFGNEQESGDERLTIKYPFSASFYAQSKAEAEQLMVEASKKPDRHVVIINPTFMIGAYDSKPSSGKLLLMAYKKKIMVAPGGGKNFVDVQSVAVAVCNALLQGKNGERYLASGINLSFKEFYTLQKITGNYKQLILGIPDYILEILGRTGDMLRKSGIKTSLCTMNLQQLMIQEYYSNLKAKEELDLPETKLPVAIKKAMDWFKEQHMA